ncbi:MAG TPA: ATP-binding protein, partial [Thermomonas sp.]|nr:ATP-binding protein [Thermomonas sp.]
VPYIGRRIPVGLKRGDRMEDRIVDFVFQPIVDDAGRVDGIFIQGSDITEQAVAELDAQTERGRLDAVIESLPSGVIIADRSGAIVRTNAANREIWGAHPMSATISEYGAWRGWWADGSEHHGEPVRGEDWALARALRGEVVKGDVAEIQPFDGSPRRTLLLQARPIRLEDGTIAGAVAAQTDISDRMRAESELRASERALRETGRRKDEFLAMLAHELRNPLAPISTASQLLLLNPDPARVRAASEVITRQVRHMTELVDDLLDVSRVTRGLVQLDMEAVDLKEVIVGAIEQVRPLIDARRHSLRTRMTAEPVWVRGDRTRLVQVFANILNNAAKYTPEAGDIGIELDVQAGRVAVRIEDSGQGIEAALLPQIFELFTQAERTPDRAQGGLGIGLALVRSLVQLHGGSISADSAGSGRGAVFTVSLPAIEPVAASDESGDAAPAGRDNGSLDVVVVDDNVDAARTLQGLLEALGHRVRIFHRALDALEAIVAQPPAVALLDIGLPDITGYELAKRIRARLGERRCLLSALSGYGQPQDIAESRQSGMDHHLIKPLDYAQLMAVLAEAAALVAQSRPGSGHSA